jgi:hypothetical protein
VFVGAAGSPYAAFRRAVEARNLTRAITEARDLPQISLADAAELVVLAAVDHQTSFDRWAGRWAARYALEEPNVTLGELRSYWPAWLACEKMIAKRPRWR